MIMCGAIPTQCDDCGNWYRIGSCFCKEGENNGNN